MVRTFTMYLRGNLRRMGLGFLITGLISLGLGMTNPSLRTILYPLGLISILVAILSIYFPSTNRVPIELVEILVQMRSHDFDQIVDSDEYYTYYLPKPRSSFQSESILVVSDTAMQDETRFDEHEIQIRPVGDLMFDVFLDNLKGGTSRNPEILSLQLSEALTELFELVGNVSPHVYADKNTVEFRVDLFEEMSINKLDHPVVSFLAVGLVHGLKKKVTVDEIDSIGESKYHIKFGVFD